MSKAKVISVLNHKGGVGKTIQPRSTWAARYVKKGTRFF